MKVTIVGTGYVGLVTGVCLADVGHDVVCVDVDADKVAKLKDGISPIYEPGIENLIVQNLEHGRLSFSTSLEESLKDVEVAFIAVGTPEGEDGSADLQYVKAVAADIGKFAVSDFVTVVKSTVPVGTCQIVEDTINSELKKRQASYDIPVASNPEFLKEGMAVDDFMKPDRIVIGVTSEAQQKLFQSFYRPFVMDDPSKLIFMDRTSSELTKYGSNAMLATRISFMNELSRLCEKVGANIDHIRLGMGADPRIGKKFLYAGPGYGGSCFPKDVKALVRTGRQKEVPMKVLEAVEDANDDQKKHVADKVSTQLGDLKGKKIAVWGLAFKPGTDDVREAPAAVIIDRFLTGGAQVVAHDPQAEATFARDFKEHPQLSYAKSAYSALEGCDALVLITEWKEYRRPNWKRVTDLMRGNHVFDLRNQYQADAFAGLDISYHSVGRPSF